MPSSTPSSTSLATSSQPTGEHASERDLSPHLHTSKGRCHSLAFCCVPLPALAWQRRDNDGDLDLLVTEYADEYPTGNATLRWYENGGSASVPQFDSDAAVFVLHLATDVLTSRMLDLDGDGLLDLVVLCQLHHYATVTHLG